MAPKKSEPSAKHFTEWKETSKGAEFSINDLDVALVNSVRRVVLSEIPNVAFHHDPYNPDTSSIRIITNTGSLHNEMLGHRLMLIPLCFTPDEIFAIEQGDQSYKFVLKVHNTGKDIVTVTSDDFVIYDQFGKVIDGDEKDRILPKNPITKDAILITKLKPNAMDPATGEQINVECTPLVGTAMRHAAWNPVSLCVYLNKIDETAAEAAFDTWIVDQGRIRESENRTALTTDDIAEYKRRFWLQDAQRHYIKNAHGEPSAFKFSMESECGMLPSFLMFRAFDVLARKMTKLVKGLKTTKITQHQAESTLFDVLLVGETHTMGNLLQSSLFDRHVRGKEASCLFIGYYQSHPLEDEVVLRIRMKTIHEIEPFKEFLLKSFEDIRQELFNVCDEWIDFAKVPKETDYVKQHQNHKDMCAREKEIQKEVEVQENQDGRSRKIGDE
jgi:DNA-directed RNA polymerase subunit L/DNA-directed RNA polymerase alpha subunit